MTRSKKKKTGLEVFLTLGLCVFVVRGTLYSNRLSKDGVNVCKEWKWRTVATSTLVSTVSYQTYNSRSKLCGWRRCRKSRTVTGYKLKTIYRWIIDTYFRCCNGWRRRGNECPIAICRYGCKNGGSCYSPNRCSCTPFWTGSNCGIDVNECSSNNGDCQQHCINRRGASRLCSCYSGYKTSPYDSKKCVDVDECQRLIDCTCASGSNSCGQSCRNTVGSYYCTCGKSYRLQSSTMCTETCYPPWTELKRHYYWVVEARANRWANAMSQCLKLNAQMIIISSEEEIEFFKELAKVYLREKKSTRAQMWLRPKKMHAVGNFLWVDGSPLKGYTNWTPGESNNARGQELCTEILVSGKYQLGKWNDVNCRITRHKAVTVCEKPLREGK